MDEENEAVCEQIAEDAAAGHAVHASFILQQQQQHSLDCQAVLLEVLEQQQLLTDRVRHELQQVRTVTG